MNTLSCAHTRAVSEPKPVSLKVSRSIEICTRPMGGEWLVVVASPNAQYMCLDVATVVVDPATG
jgi:hypothetical protein